MNDLIEAGKVFVLLEYFKKHECNTIKLVITVKSIYKNMWYLCTKNQPNGYGLMQKRQGEKICEI